MDEFDLQIEKAVARGQRERKLKSTRAANKAMSEEELRRLHNEYRLELSEYIEQCLSRLPKYLPGFICQTVVDDRNQKRRRLTRAGLRATGHIFALQRAR